MDLDAAYARSLAAAALAPLRDLVPGLLVLGLLLTRPFCLGDEIKAGGFEGPVEDIQVRVTTIRTYDNRRTVLPNSRRTVNRTDEQVASLTATPR
jgi:small-conductance mechanosensitive channel